MASSLAAVLLLAFLHGLPLGSDAGYYPAFLFGRGAEPPADEPQGFALAALLRVLHPWMDRLEADAPATPLSVATRPSLPSTNERRPAVFLMRERRESAEPDRKPSRRLEGAWGTLHLHWDLDRPDAAPVTGERWRTQEFLDVPVAGPFFVFGQLIAGYDTLTAQEMSLIGTTGLGYKLQPLDRTETQLRGGSRKFYKEDPLRPERQPKDSLDLLLEVRCRHNLLGPLDLEYQGTALPALDPFSRHRVKQDLWLALPIGGNGQISVGARHEWQASPSPRPLADGMQLYLGFGLRR